MRFGYSPIHDPLEQHANYFGYTLGDFADTAQQLCDALNLCHKEYILTDDEYNIAVTRLNDMVLDNLTEEED